MNLLGLFIVSVFIVLFFAYFILFSDSKKYTFLKLHIKDKPPKIIFEKIDIRTYRPDTIFSPNFSCSVFCYKDYIIIGDFNNEKISPQVWYLNRYPNCFKKRLINRVRIRHLESLDNSLTMRGFAVIVNLPFHFYMNSYKNNMVFKSKETAHRFLNLYN